MNKYARKAAIVQSGWVTQSVSRDLPPAYLATLRTNFRKIMTLIALSIICTCVVMLVIARIDVAD